MDPATALFVGLAVELVEVAIVIKGVEMVGTELGDGVDNANRGPPYTVGFVSRKGKSDDCHRMNTADHIVFAEPQLNL